jgi:sugar (pentulose or hexulose) kinase
VEYFAGIDLGTSGCRLTVIDTEETVQYENRILYPSADHQSPDLWLASAYSLLSTIPSQIRSDLKALSIDGTSGTVLLCDEHGKPTTPALMYNDARARAEALQIKSIAPKDTAAHGANSSLAKLLFLLSHYPSETHAHATHQADWISGMLTGNFLISDENNCLKMGYDPVQRNWPVWIQQLNIPDHLLPKVLPPASVISTIQKHQAEKLHLPQNLQIVTGTTDSIAAFIATKASKVGEAVTSLGSTLAIKVITDKPVFAPELGVYSHRLWDTWLAGGASNTGGAVIKHYFADEEIEAFTHQLNPKQLINKNYYPLVEKGERFPINDPDKFPVLQPQPDNRAEFFQSILEGIANIEVLAYQVLQKLGANYPVSVLTVGGGSKNMPWCEIRKKKLGVDVLVPAVHEAAYGSAILAKKGYDTF